MAWSALRFAPRWDCRAATTKTALLTFAARIGAVLARNSSNKSAFRGHLE